jgi:hypothetical protein
MKKLFFASFLTLIFSFAPSGDQVVYLCNNGKTEVYHVNPNCYSLKRCTHEIVKMYESEARGKGKRLCGNE